LKIGDRVLTYDLSGKGATAEEITNFLHKETNIYSKFLRIKTTENTVLEISEEHILYTEQTQIGNKELIAAKYLVAFRHKILVFQ